MELNKFKRDDELGREGPWIQVTENISFCDRDSEIIKVCNQNNKWKWELYVNTPIRENTVRIPPFELGKIHKEGYSNTKIETAKESIKAWYTYLHTNDAPGFFVDKQRNIDNQMN